LHEDHVGSVYNFSSPTPRSGDVTCENCNKQREAKTLATGQVPITSALIHRFRQSDLLLSNCMKQEYVEPWLQKNLDWRVTLVREITFDRPRLLALLIRCVERT
jgi:tyrosinase